MKPAKRNTPPKTKRPPAVVVDFSAVITEIMAHGLSQADIARHVGISQGNVSCLVNRIRGGPPFQTGAKLLLLRNQLNATVLKDAP